MANTINGDNKTSYIIQNGFCSSDEEIQEILNKCDEEYGVTLIKDINDKILFMCDPEILDRIRKGEFNIVFNENYRETLEG